MYTNTGIVHTYKICKKDKYRFYSTMYQMQNFAIYIWVYALTKRRYRNVDGLLINLIMWKRYKLKYNRGLVLHKINVFIYAGVSKDK